MIRAAGRRQDAAFDRQWAAFCNWLGYMQAEFYDSFCASDAPLSSAARIPASLVATKGDDWTGGSKMTRNAQMECWRQHGRSLAFAVSARALASGRIGFVALVAMLFAISVVRCEDIVTIRSGRAGKDRIFLISYYKKNK